MSVDFDAQTLWKLQHILTAKERKEIFHTLCKKNRAPWFTDLPATLPQVLGHPEPTSQRLGEVGRGGLISFLDVETIRGTPFPRDDLLALSFLGGPVECLRKPTVAIVGSRHPTSYGRSLARAFGRYLAERGCVIVSGGAIGIDTEGVQGALCAPQGQVCVVVGGGLQNLYPSSNRGLFNHIVQKERGLVVSEFCHKDRAAPWHFPTRNRTLAALSDFILVIECRVPSGTLHTAWAGADYGIDVGAIPGPLDAPLSTGPHLLMGLGAHCVTHPSEILFRVNGAPGRRPR